MKLSVHLVTWNGARYIPYLFDSLRKQTYTDWKLIVLDNGSSDDTIAHIKKEIRDLVDAELIELKENLGFAGGHNKLYQQTKSEYILLLNQDMYLMPDALERMVTFLDAHTDVAAVSPRLMRWDFEKEMDGLTDKIDSLGLKVFRNRRVIEKYTGKDWDTITSKVKQSFHTKDNAMEVFGVSGALPMYRRFALDMVRFDDGNFFDSLYTSYKEDVDLAFRLRIAGYRAHVLLDTVAYHDRSAEGLEKKGDSVAAKNKKKQSEWVKYHSYKNHLMTIYKNEYWGNWILDAIFIKWYEIKKFFYFLLLDRAVLKGLTEIWKHRKELNSKRKKVTDIRKVSWRELRHWWK